MAHHAPIVCYSKACTTNITDKHHKGLSVFVTISLVRKLQPSLEMHLHTEVIVHMS